MLRTTHSRPRSWLMVLLLIGCALASALPLHAQTVEPKPDWLAVSISVDYSITPVTYMYTVYAGKNNTATQTATILKWEETDITANCITHGTFGAPDANGYLAFDGSTNYVECTTPGISSEWLQMYPTHPLEGTITCNGGAPLFASGDVKLSTGTRSNPVIAAPALGITYSLPRSGNLARSQLWVGNTYQSSNWTAQTNGNQVLIGGRNGPAIIAADTKFGWLNYLNTSWKPGFRPLFGTTMRHWYQPTNTLFNLPSVPTYTLSTAAHSVYFGYNPADGSYFKGSIRKAVADPGCPAS